MGRSASLSAENEQLNFLYRQRKIYHSNSRKEDEELEKGFPICAHISFGILKMHGYIER